MIMKSDAHEAALVRRVSDLARADIAVVGGAASRRFAGRSHRVEAGFALSGREAASAKVMEGARCRGAS